MIKKFLLNTVATIVLLNVCDTHNAFSMERDDRCPAGGVMRPNAGRDMMSSNSYQAVPLFTKQKLDQKEYRRQSQYAPYYPLFDIDSKLWITYQAEDFKRILDSKSSEMDRLKAFNRLSYSVESELIVIRHPERCSIECNKKHVATVGWLAKAVLWHNSTMDAGESTSFNFILLKILRHTEDGQKIYDNYLDRIYDHLRHAVRIQEHLIEICSGEERFLSADLPTVSNSRRILGILKADQARVYELKLFKRNRDEGLYSLDSESNNIVDRFQILRRNAYDLYSEASDNGGSKLCILQRMKLIDEQGYSPAGNKERDRAILLDLGAKYLRENEDFVEEAAIRTQVRGIASSSSNKVPAAIPKPRGARDYIACVLAKHSAGVLGHDTLGVEDAAALSGEAEWSEVVTISGAGSDRVESGNIKLSVLTDSSAMSSQHLALSGGGRSMHMPVSDTRDLLTDSADAPLNFSFTKSTHLSPSKQDEIRNYFKTIGGRDGAVSRYGSLEKAYKSIGEEFNATKSQVSYALFRQAEYAKKRKSSALQVSRNAESNVGSDNEGAEMDDVFSAKKIGPKKKCIIISDDESRNK